MIKVLVVDDFAVDRRLAATILDELGARTLFASDGKEALAVVAEELPDLVLTDMKMPNLDGLGLVCQLRDDYPFLPVILMTAHGSEELAVQALKSGASSYVPKQNLSRDLEPTIRDVLAVSRTQRAVRQVMDYMTETEARFEVGCEVSNHEGLIGHVQELLKQMGICDDSDMLRVGTALHEALVNAREHGNLELDSDLRDAETGDYFKLAEKRCTEAPFADRRVHVHAHLNRNEAIIRIRDEGPGFDPSRLPDPTDPENLGRVSGRGLFLIQTFMDEVRFNEAGNEIQMIKRRKA